MTAQSVFKTKLAVPVIGAPMFIVSGPELVLAQCKAGIVGSFPAMNARSISMLDEWLAQITEDLAAWDKSHPETPSAPFAVNEIVHTLNDRLDAELELCRKYNVPLVITAFGARVDVNAAIHAYGGAVMHDATTNRFARKAVECGADGLIAVAAGAGGHGGALSPFALVADIREWFAGPLALAGAIATGRSVLAAQAAGADFGYVGSAFIATNEANAVDRYKDVVVQSESRDIIYTNLFTGIPGNYLRSSILAAGFDPDNLPPPDPSTLDFGSGGNTQAKVWKDIWGCGQGIGQVKSVMGAGELVARLKREYGEAVRELAARWAVDCFEGSMNGRSGRK